MSHPDEAAAIDLPGGDRLALYAFSAGAADRGTIVRLNHQRRLWTASPPDNAAPDAFVSLGYEGSVVIADTWQGLRVRIDPDTGAILDSTFVK
jgi:hypothetical protein